MNDPAPREETDPNRRAKAAFFDEAVTAPWSAEAYTAEELAWLHNLLDQLAIQQGDWILEPGCGSGRLSVLLAHRVGSIGRVWANDISGGMLSAAKKQTAGLACVQLLPAPAETLPLPQQSLQAVLCHQVFPHLDQPGVALRNWQCALRPGGYLVVSHFRSSAAINHHHRRTHPAVAGDYLPPAPELAGKLEAAGFTIVQAVDTDSDGYQLIATR